ncbi:MAG TPA: DUF2782 domain-containing protein [Arenicellales bacterium]|nr:DUF2782 domain-containing protein [Arenicellales bacterium]
MIGKTRAVYAVATGLGLILAAFSGAGPAQDNDAADAPRPPEVEQSESGADGQAPRVDVRQRQEYGQTITEYSRGDRVFLMTVKPRNGPTQYWDDPDGDGQFQRRTSDDIDENLNLPKWKLGDW